MKLNKTGLMGVNCRHSQPLRYENSVSGEHYAVTTHLVHTVVDLCPPESTVYLLYDIACMFAPALPQVDPVLCSRLKESFIYLSCIRPHAELSGVSLPQAVYGPQIVSELAKLIKLQLRKLLTKKFEHVSESYMVLSQTIPPPAKHDCCTEATLIHPMTEKLCKQERNSGP